MTDYVVECTKLNCKGAVHLEMIDEWVAVFRCDDCSKIYVYKRG